MGITPQQARVVHFLQHNGPIGATYDEIASHLGLRSKNGAKGLVDRLVARGWLRRLPHRPRAIEVLRRLPDQYYAPFPAARFGVEPAAGRPTAYLGPYPIRDHGTCADWFDSLVDHAAPVTDAESAVNLGNSRCVDPAQTEARS